MPPSLTREELTRHKVPTYPLSVNVTGWEVRPGGGEGREIVIPAGARMVGSTRTMCAKLIAFYGDDRSVADVLFPDGRYESVFYRLSEAAVALPERVDPVVWCADTQTYEPSGDPG